MLCTLENAGYSAMGKGVRGAGGVSAGTVSKEAPAVLASSLPALRDRTLQGPKFTRVLLQAQRSNILGAGSPDPSPRSHLNARNISQASSLDSYPRRA